MDEKTPINAKITVRIAPDKRTAHAIVSAPQNGGRNPLPDEVSAALTEAGVVFGIRPEAVHLLTGSHDYGKQELVAVGVLPVKGTDASLAFHFTAEKELKPREMEDGSVDYKDLGIVTNSKAGDILATKTPATEGTPGTNVLGEPIPAPSGKDIALPAGSGTKISEDGLHLEAVINGQAGMVSKRVTVSDVFNVEQDVGVATGNIEFLGNVRVKGNVLAGFMIKATGSVTVNGMLDGGKVDAGGNVSIDNGLNGGEVISGGDVRCKFFQNGKISAKGSVYVGVIIGSTVRSGEKIAVQGAKSKIYNSTLSARDSINVINVGTEGHSKPVILEAGSDPELTLRKANNPKEIAEAEKKLISIEMLYNAFAEREKRGSLPADKIKDYENIKLTREQLQNTLAQLQIEREEIEENMASMGYGTVIITGNIAEGTRIIIGAEQYVVPGNDRFVRFRRDQQLGIISGPAK
ncbi:MAG: FapA family protein [Oscillospiraceae bacterium]|nr:FapA family protein [Oscillospiraceae bacterium]